MGRVGSEFECITIWRCTFDILGSDNAIRTGLVLNDDRLFGRILQIIAKEIGFAG
jgi:hypothetical protein